MVDGLDQVEDRHMSHQHLIQPSLKQNDEKIICTITDVSCTIFFKRARQNSVANILAGGGLVRPNDIV
jgi:hypothetical protein